MVPLVIHFCQYNGSDPDFIHRMAVNVSPGELHIQRAFEKCAVQQWGVRGCAGADQALPCPMALRAEPALNQVIWLSLNVWFTGNS